MYGKNIRYWSYPQGGPGESMSENDRYDEVPLGGFGGFDNEWDEGYDDGGEGMKGLWKMGDEVDEQKQGILLIPIVFVVVICLTVGYILTAVGGRLKNITVFQYIIYF